MQLDNGTSALVIVVLALAFLVWAGRQRAPAPGEKTSDPQVIARLTNLEREMKELRRGQVRIAAVSESAQRVAQKAVQDAGATQATLLQIQWMLQQVAADLTILKSASAGAEAAERTLNQQRQGGGVTVNTAAPGMHFSGDATIHGPAIGGNVGTLGPAPPTPPKLERPHTI